MDVPAARRVRHRNDRCNRPGFLYNPKTQDINSRDALAGVCVLQLAGRYILAGVDCRADVPDGPEEQDTPDRISYSTREPEGVAILLHTRLSVVRRLR